MCRRRGIRRYRADFNPVRTIDIERAVVTDCRLCEHTVPAANRQVAPGIGNRQAGAITGPSAVCNRCLDWCSRAAVARCQQTAQ